MKTVTTGKKQEPPGKAFTQTIVENPITTKEAIWLSGNELQLRVTKFYGSRNNKKNK